MSTLLMATDLSARSDRALQRAVALARDRGAELEVLHVVDESLPEGVARRHEDTARSAIYEQLISVGAPGDVRVSTRIVRGHDYEDILRRAEEIHAQLIVLGIHRHAGPELFHGTTAERVARFGHAPLLVVKDPVLGPYRRIVVPVDLSIHSRRALALACAWAPRGEVHIVYAVHAPFKGLLGPSGVRQIVQEERKTFGALLERDLTELTARLGSDAPYLSTVLAEGDARHVIREQVERLKPDLLAIGTHGRTGVARALLGSVAEDLLADAPVDVLAVKAW